jgi:antirestriction protein ArdC
MPKSKKSTTEAPTEEKSERKRSTRHAVKDAYDKVLSAVVGALEKGVVPWRRGYKVLPQQSFVRGTVYRGWNRLFLSCAGHPSPFWFTFNDLKTLAGDAFLDAEGKPIPLVKKGEVGIPILFWKRLTVKDRAAEGSDTPKTKVIPLLRYYVVFNLAQVNLPEEALKKIAKKDKTLRGSTATVALDPIEKAVAAYIGNKGPTVVHKRQACLYAPKTDTVNTPALGHYPEAERYYADLLHELGHSTGHTSRLHRFEADKAAPFGSEPYAEEELVAELATAFLSDEFGIAHKTLENSEAYIAGWLKVLQSDPKLLIKAAGKAAKAADLILGRKPSYAEAEAQQS